MPVYLCGCEEEDVAAVTDTVRLVDCDGVAVLCPVPLPIALPGGPIITNLAAIPPLVQETREDIVVQWHPDGCRLNVTRPGNAAPTGNVTTWPVVVAPVVDNGNANAPLCPLPTRVTYQSTIYKTITTLADAVEGSFPAGTTVVVPGADGCSVVIAHQCRGDVPAAIGVEVPPPTATTSVAIVNAATGVPFNPVPWPVAFQGVKKSTITELAVAAQAALGAGFTVTPNANGYELLVTRPSEAAPPGPVQVSTTMVTTYPVRDVNRNVTMCPVLFPVTGADHFAVPGTVFTNMTQLVAGINPPPVGWFHAVNPDGCRVDLTHPVSGVPSTTPPYIGVRSLAAAFRADSQATATYSNLIGEPATATDPLNFKQLLVAGGAWTAPATPAGSVPVYSSGWISDLRQPDGFPNWMRVEFDVVSWPATLPHPLSGTVIPQPMAVGLRLASGGSFALRTFNGPDRLSGPVGGYMQAADTANQPNPHARFGSVGRFRLDFFIGGLAPTSTRLGFAVIPPGAQLADLTIAYLP